MAKWIIYENEFADLDTIRTLSMNHGSIAAPVGLICEDKEKMLAPDINCYRTRVKLNEKLGKNFNFFPSLGQLNRWWVMVHRKRVYQ